MTWSDDRIEKEAVAPRKEPHPPATVSAVTRAQIIALTVAMYGALLLLALLVRTD